MVSPNEKERFIEELKELPIVSVICKRLGIARATYYRWMQEDSDFNDKVSIALKTGRENITDIAEGQLVASIRKAERWALTYWLEANSDRYYKPRKTHDTMKPEYRGVTEFVIVRDCNNPEHDKGNRKTDIRIERREIRSILRL